MCNGQNQGIIDAVIQDKVTDGEAFTAWDVTQEARRRGADEQHYQLKTAVHGSWSWLNGQMNYHRQTIQLPNVAIDPWLYYPDGFDPQMYIDAISNQIATAVADPDDDPVADPDDDDTDTDDDPAPSVATVSRNGFRTVSKNGRVMVPTAKVRQLRLLTGQTAYVYTDGNTLYIASPTTQIDANWVLAGTLQITTHDRLYLQPRFLQLIALKPTGNRFSTLLNGDRIEVAQA